MENVPFQYTAYGVWMSFRVKVWKIILTYPIFKGPLAHLLHKLSTQYLNIRWFYEIFFLTWGKTPE